MQHTSNARTVLLSGASSGIGEATAVALAKAGYSVYAVARRVERMQHLETLGIHVLYMDVTDDASMQDAVAQVTKQAGAIDVLINNAGYGSYGALEEVSPEEARRQVAVNLFGVARLCQLVIPQMRQARQGTIINITSIGSHFGEAFGAWYHATKYAVAGLSDSMRLELQPFGIKVVRVEPGLIKTGWDGIATELLQTTSSHGPYAAAAKRKAESLRKVYSSSLTSPPQTVASAIVRILDKPNPRLRYAVGGNAKPFLLLRRLMSDRLFYKILNRT